MKNSYEVAPLSLLSASRLDVVAKYLFLKNQSSNFFGELYKQHLFCSTGGTFVEFDQPQKNSYEKFVESFVELSSDIGVSGFVGTKNAIPIDSDKILVNGAHRLAASIFHGQNVKVTEVKALGQRQDYEFFQRNGLNSIFLNEIIKNFVILKDTVRLACIWGTALEKYECCAKRMPGTFFEKDFKLTEQGEFNLIFSCYFNEPWITTSADPFRSVFYKTDACFDGAGVVKLLLFDTGTNVAAEWKECFRDYAKVGKHSVHTTDNHEDTIELAKVFLNENSLFFLNNANPKYWISLRKKVRFSLQNIQKKCELDTDEFIFDGSTSLEAFGLRQANDIDVLVGQSSNCEFSRRSHENYHTKDNLTLIQHPQNYFYFCGYKFITLANLAMFKSNRREPKDLKDMLLVKNFVKDNRINLGIFRFFFKRQAYRLRVALVKFLKYINIYNTLRRFM